MSPPQVDPALHLIYIGPVKCIRDLVLMTARPSNRIGACQKKFELFVLVVVMFIYVFLGFRRGGGTET